MLDPADTAPAAPRETGRRTALAAAAAAATFFSGRRAPAARASGAAAVRIAGTGGALGAMRALVEAHRRSDPSAAAVRFLPNFGSSGGISAVLEGEADLALTARPPTGAERAAGALYRAYARTPFAFATHEGTPVRSLALADAVRIYAGDLAEWPDGSPVRLVRRPFNDTDTTVLRGLSQAMAQAVDAAQRRPGLITAGNDHENADALEAVRGSFGGVALSQVLAERRRLVLLALEGVEPGLEALAAGRYPLAKTFGFVTRGEPSAAAAALMDFVAGPEGGAALAVLGQERSDAPRGGA
jgi:phosphate transport system substrate-binding protein